MNDLEFLPPYRFSEIEHQTFGPEGSGGIFQQGSGTPYDLIDDLPLSGGRTTRARGGAVHFDNPPRTNKGSRSYPTIDRGFYFTVDEDKVITQAFWGVASDYYFQTLVRSNEASIWAYADKGKKNFKVIADDNKASIAAWAESPSPSKYIIINTEDFPDNADPADLVVKLREMEICEKDENDNPKKILVLCSQPYKS